MKALKNVLNLSLLFLLVAPFTLSAQNKEIPITTSSKEALDLFLESEEKVLNAENVDATILLDKAIRIDQNFAMAYLYKSFLGGGSTAFRKNLDKAVNLVDKVTEGERLRILFYQALFNGNGQKQKECIDELLAKFPSDKRVRQDAGFYYFNNNDLPNALVNFTEASKLDKTDAFAFNMIGYCQFRLNNYPEAEKAFLTYIKLRPDKANPYDSYGELLLKMGKYDESIVQYKKAIEINPKFSASLIGIGNNYIFKGDFETARKYYKESYDKATNVDGKFGALYWIAVSYVHEGNTEKALKTYDDYRGLAEKENLVPNIIDAYSKQGWIIGENGHPEEGFKTCEKAIALVEDPRLSEPEKESFRTYTLLWRFGHFVDINEFDNAKAESAKCRQKLETRKNSGEDLWLNSLFGYMDLKLGNYDEALNWYLKSNQESPYNWYKTAIIYNKKGDKQNATKYFEKIVACNVNSIDLAFVRGKALNELKK